ncbi:hypothetical protein D3C75_819290 [compost metagenome]
MAAQSAVILKITPKNETLVVQSAVILNFLCVWFRRMIYRGAPTELIGISLRIRRPMLNQLAGLKRSAGKHRVILGFLLEKDRTAA